MTCETGIKLRHKLEVRVKQFKTFVGKDMPLTAAYVAKYEADAKAEWEAHQKTCAECRIAAAQQQPALWQG